MKILLILACAPNDPLKKNDPFMPLSLPILAGSAPNHQYDFVDMLANDQINFQKKYDLVGISYRISAQARAFEIADRFRQAGMKVVAGGPQPTCEPSLAAEHFDSVAIGEGEVLWPKILEDVEKKQLKKYYICSPQSFSQPADQVFHVDHFYDLAIEPVPVRKYYKKGYVFDTVFASRGCPVDCDFCAVPAMYGYKNRFRKITDVVAEINTFRNYYYLLDDTVFGRPNCYAYYKELYTEINHLKKKRFWTGQANLNAANDPEGQEVIRLAAQSGLVYAAIGMESIDPEVMKKSGVIKKMGQSSYEDVLAQMKENICFIQEQGIVISGWFVIGYEDDTLESIDRILEFCSETNILPIINPLEALPNTRLYDKLQAENRISSETKINIKHPTINEDDLIKRIKEAIESGFSFEQIMKRTLFYYKKFKPSKNIGDIIHKTIFTYIMQSKIKKGVMALANSGDF
ncbi:MAG: radical SAM protein [Spirochaetes bacterium]|nr:radical SAM protein [Spirochaetota bacterium]